MKNTLSICLIAALFTTISGCGMQSLSEHDDEALESSLFMQIIPSPSPECEDEMSIQPSEKTLASTEYFPYVVLPVSLPENASYDIMTETYSSPIITSKDNILIHYPQLQGLSDKRKEKAINDIILEELIYNELKKDIYYNEEYDIYNIRLDYQIIMKTDKILSVLYTGISSFHLGYTSFDIFAITIDLEDEKKLKLSDFMPIDEDLYQRILDSRDVVNYAVQTGEMSKDELWENIQRGFNIEHLIDERRYYTFCVSLDSLYVSIKIEPREYAIINILDAVDYDCLPVEN